MSSFGSPPPGRTDVRGAGFEAPRGALGHWIVIENRKIAIIRRSYHRPGTPVRAMHRGQPGAYEAALQDEHTLADSSQPLEILRTIHSFDPCIACAVHLSDEDGEELLGSDNTVGGLHRLL